MTTQELELAIREYLKDIYKADYIGKLSVTKPNGYLIKLGLNTPDTPITIYTELEDDSLKKFLIKELRDRRLSPYFFGNLELIYPSVCNNVKKKCCDT